MIPPKMRYDAFCEDGQGASHGLDYFPSLQVLHPHLSHRWLAAAWDRELSASGEWLGICSIPSSNFWPRPRVSFDFIMFGNLFAMTAEMLFYHVGNCPVTWKASIVEPFKYLSHLQHSR
jgi:hypothetical protein